MRPLRFLQLLGFVLALVATSLAVAQCAPSVAPFSNPRVVPEPAPAGARIALRLDAESCAVTNFVETRLDGTVLHVRHVSDRGPACAGAREEELSLPALPVGNYVLSYEPEASISLSCYQSFAGVPFGVVPAPAASVPTLRPEWLGVLAVLLLFVPLLLRRSRTS